MAQLRSSTLMHLAQAEARLAVSPGEGPQRALALAEEFEDVEAIVHLASASDAARLDAYLGQSETFREVALEQFLRAKELQPFFFRALQKFNVPTTLRDRLLEPYPELQWTLDAHSLGASAADHDKVDMLKGVQRKTAAMAQREKNSAAKRDSFAALSLLARFAAGGDESSEEPAVGDLACIGRLRNAAVRLAQEVSVGNKRPHPDGPPNTAEECLFEFVRLLDVMRSILKTFREEGRERQIFADAARLVRIVERGLTDRGVSISSLLKGVTSDPSSNDDMLSDADANVVWSLKKLWRNVIMADRERWNEINAEAEGSARTRHIAETGYYQMLACEVFTSPVGWRPSQSADVGVLSTSFEELQSLSPALRLAENEVSSTLGNQRRGITLTTSGAGA